MAETAPPVETPAATPPASAEPSPAPEATPAPNGSAAPAAQPNGEAAPDGAAPAAQPAADPSLGAGGGTESEPGPTPASWPENWRDIASGGDQKTLQYLNRYASPVNVVKALMATRQKISAGELMQAKPEGDPNDPAVKTALEEWRAQAGVPETPEGYLEKVPDGIVFGEADKPMLDSFLQDMHAKDAPPAYVHQALQWYKQLEQQQIEQQAENDKAHRAQSEDDLRSEWGPEYRANLNGVRSMFATNAPEGLLERLFSARMADGTPLGDDPDTLRFLVSLNREVNPHGTVPTPDSPQGKALSSRKEEIRNAMRDNNSPYYRGDKDEHGETAMQREYRQIIEQEQKREGR